MVKGAVTSATDMLVGKAAGVSVITDGGAPGAGATIRVRGGSSMSASNNPLIVIDGVPVDDGGINGMSNPLATVHPNDIETFTILKMLLQQPFMVLVHLTVLLLLILKKESLDVYKLVIAVHSLLIQDPIK